MNFAKMPNFNKKQTLSRKAVQLIFTSAKKNNIVKYDPFQMNFLIFIDRENALISQVSQVPWFFS